MKLCHAQEVKFKIQMMKEDVFHHQDVLDNTKYNSLITKMTVQDVDHVIGHMKCQILRELLAFQGKKFHVIALAEDQL